MKTILGTGIFNWPRNERVSDRYGLATVFRSVNGSVCIDHSAVDTVLGRRGHLVAVVKETRESQHIGDFFRGLSPSTPRVGDEFVLNEDDGELFDSIIEDQRYIGIAPDDDRDADCLNPEQLYKCHQQTVDLIFVCDDDVK